MIRTRIWVYLIFAVILFIALIILATIGYKPQQGKFIINVHSDDYFHEEIQRYHVEGLEYVSGIRFGKTNRNGLFKFRRGKQIGFRIGDFHLPAIKAETEISEAHFPENIQRNLVLLLLSIDEDGDRNNGIQITAESLPHELNILSLDQPEDDFSTALLNQLTGRTKVNFISTSGRHYPVQNLPYTSGAYVGLTGPDGEITFQKNKQINFHFGNVSLETDANDTLITPSTFQSNIATNLKQYLLSIDNDQNIRNGIDATPLDENYSIAFEQDQETFQQALARYLALFGRQPKLGFHPSLGINLEAPQAESNTVGQPVPFADIFRTARPFQENSDPSILYDDSGWPIQIPKESKAYTTLLHNLPKNSIPYGQYTVLYDGIGTLAYDGMARRVSFAANQDIIDIQPDNHAFQHMVVRITNTSEHDPIRNIRIIMPGGICEGLPFFRAKSEIDCKKGHYRSFLSLLKERNNIVFNPDYLRVLSHFKVIRMMNFTESSHRLPSSCNTFRNEEYRECLQQPLHWNNRSQLHHASWGGSHRTDATLRLGAPIEVLIELANILNIDPWFSIPHHATNEYISGFAELVADKLKPDLIPYVEYSNEVWNKNFWAHHFVTQKGNQLKLDKETNPFRENLKFYVQRSLETFKIWEEVFEGSNKRLVRVVSSHLRSPEHSKQLLQYKNAYENIDAIAVAPYFYACWDRRHRACKNLIGIPRLLSETTDVDEIFEVLTNPEDPYSLSALRHLITQQAEIAESFGTRLFAYEGGQHLKIDWNDSRYTRDHLEHLNTLFHQANRDPRMGDLYEELLEIWKQAGGHLFVAYTLPQTFHEWGAWGIKEHLNQPRDEAPKYNAILNFQELTGQCWWEGCEEILE